MRPLEKIKEGIETSSMALVAEGYMDMTGEELEVPEIQDADNSVILSKLNQILNIITPADLNPALSSEDILEEKIKPVSSTKKKTTKKTAKAKKLDSGEIDEPISFVKYQPPMVSGPVTSNKDKMFFPSAGLIDEEEIKINQKTSKAIKKDKRKPSKKIKCTICSKEIFNPQRMIKSRDVEEGSNLMKCPHCRGEFNCKF